MKRSIGIFIFFIFLGIGAQAQVFERQSVSSGGTIFMNEDGIAISQTVGQPYATASYYGNDFTIHPGFQQPISVELSAAAPDNALRAFPVPANDHINISMQNALSYAIVEVHDFSGKLVFSQVMNNLTTYTINLQGLADGFYALAVTDEFNNMYSSKFIISR